jgi:hypothetical protein
LDIEITFDIAQTSVLRSLGPKSGRSTPALLARSVTASITPPARPHSAGVPLTDIADLDAAGGLSSVVPMPPLGGLALVA